MTTTGRRERKKAATRQALAYAALNLFLERGYDAVTVADVADAADVSVTTLFNHFPGGKPALVFDQEDDVRAGLVDAVVQREAGCTVLEAVRRHQRTQVAFEAEHREGFARFRALLTATPALVEHARAMWARDEEALAAAVVSTTPGVDPFDARLLARFVVEGLHLASARPDAAAALDRVVDLLASGWTESVTER